MRTLLPTHILAGLLALLLFFAALPAFAEDGRIVSLETNRGVEVSFYYMKQNGARATVILLPGGTGDIKLKKGSPHSDDFLVRSRGYFFANGFNVAVVDKPDDAKRLDFRIRTSPQHRDDILQIAAYVKKDSRLPVWLVGTSRGTISATSAAISMPPDAISGLVLTSSITSSDTPGAVTSQNLARIRVPVLVVHHADDRCEICNPKSVPDIIEGLSNSPIKKAVLVSGGGWAWGNTCGSQHRHGYVGMEEKVVSLISQWIRDTDMTAHADKPVQLISVQPRQGNRLN
jgi:pimeloyl-ACP methyl ester carboxylesterase